MAYLKGFGLENFRVFKDYTWFDFAPITILVGPNNSGKSSLIKALLLLKDNYEKGVISSSTFDQRFDYDYWRNEIHFDDNNHDFSSGKSMLRSNSETDKFRIRIPYLNPFLNEKSYIQLTFIVSKMGTTVSTDMSIFNDTEIIYSQKTTDKITEVEFSLDVMSRSLKNKLVCASSDIHFETGNLDSIPYYLIDTTTLEKTPIKVSNANDLRFFKSIFSNFFLETDDYNYNLAKKASEFIEVIELFKLDTYKSKDVLKFSVQVSPSLIEHHTALFNALKSNGYSTSYAKIITELMLCKTNEFDAELFTPYQINEGKHLFRYLKDIVYIPIISGLNRRYYTSIDENPINKAIKGLSRKHLRPEFEDFLTKWKINFAIENIDWETIEEVNLNSLTINSLPLTEIGSGLTQIAALLINIVNNSNQRKWKNASYDGVDNSIFLISEPESNLHPKYQSILSNLFTDAAVNFNTQFIIETHSEYMIRKFQYLVAKGEMKSEDIVIHYFHDPNNIPAGEKQVKKINILEDGSLSDDFGPGFYDEAANWELELIKLKRNKSRQN